MEKSIQLTAMCVSNLLEHLLESDDLLAKHSNEDGNSTLPHGEPSKPRHHDLTGGPPETKGAHFAARSHPEGGEVEVVAVANLQEGEQPQAPPCSPASVVQSTARRSTCCSSDRVPAVIFVGFGTGANSLLHLASGPLRVLSQSPKHEGGDGRGGRSGGVGEGEHGSGGQVDGGRDLPDGHDGERRKREQGNDVRGGAEAGYGHLTSVLHNKGLRVGGLVLANGFVSLDEDSTQARRPRRH